ncbi:hypothetical protein HGRIS_014295 [Hohenbuehelia grisea]|uniref:WD40 repeat-like protein n=1 Tax=Hohenbuehelia grisea TaxID=104357 RepID=A0ABR3JUE1_9AGAR
MWSPPAYAFANEPSLKYETRVLVAENDEQDNFFRQAQWCPDGSSVLATAERSELQVMYPPAMGTHVFQQPAPVLDFAWFPGASAHDEASYCFLASVRECPLKLLHGADGRLRASYPIIDHRERFIAPHSLAFGPGTTNIFCGFEDAIEILDMNRPGHEGTRLHTTPNKKSKDGLKGIISALAFPPYTGSSESYLAAGSLSPSGSNIALFDVSQSSDAAPVLFLDTGPHRVRAGVMQLQFSPTRPHLLYSSFRRHGSIYEWDIRGDGGIPSNIFVPGSGSLASTRSRTNQKLRFDITSTGQWLAVGDQMGDISVFDLEAPAVHDDTTAGSAEPTLTEPVVSSVQPKSVFHAHEDAIGSVSFHPLEAELLSVSGSRHFDREPLSSPDDSDSSDSEVEADLDSTDGEVSSLQSPSSPSSKLSLSITRHRRRPHPVTLDNSVKLWSCG